ncbi:MAG: dihydroneopterin aldolase [Lentimicrobiaceae bacterium]|jgi:dihydroneopterin aldolase|nr:dihydroneopterin aldolase [Lentimicrobiaceae bacterium]
MSVISIEGMEFYAYHGCFEEEQVVGTWFEVDLFMNVDTLEAEQQDDLKKTVNYQQVYQVVKREMMLPSKLLEHVGNRILTAICSEFSTIQSAQLKIKKKNPPLGGKINFVSILLEQKR